MSDIIDQIETIIGRKVKRDIVRMANWAKGNLGKAAESIMSTPNAHVGIVTGFYIKHANPPSPETDGLGGMAHLAAGFARAGGGVTAVSGAPCAQGGWGVVHALALLVALEGVSVAEPYVPAFAGR